jgi:hypothetical protein
VPVDRATVTTTPSAMCFMFPQKRLARPVPRVDWASRYRL